MFRIVFAGVFDRYPTIRIVTHHQGGFVPLLAPRLGNVWPAIKVVGLPMPTKISKPYVEHFRKFYCDTAASGFAPKALELAVDFFGPERVVFGSDSPFDVQDGQIFTAENTAFHRRYDCSARNACRYFIQQRDTDSEIDVIFSERLVPRASIKSAMDRELPSDRLTACRFRRTRIVEGELAVS